MEREVLLVLVLGSGGGHGFCDKSTKAVVIKNVTMGQNLSKLRDVIFGQPLSPLVTGLPQIRFPTVVKLMVKEIVVKVGLL